MDLKTGNRGLELGFRLRPQNMPNRGFVDLNCALPAFQSVNLHGVQFFSGRMPSEIDAPVSLMRNNEDSGFAKTGIRWKFVKQELRKGRKKITHGDQGFPLFPPEGSPIRCAVLVVASIQAQLEDSSWYQNLSQ